MKAVVLPLVVAAAVGLRLLLWRRRRAGRGAPPPPARREPRAARMPRAGRLLGAAGLVAARDMRERVRGRVFRVGTVLILVVVAAAIVVPVVRHGPTRPQRVAVVGADAPPLRTAISAAASTTRVSTRVTGEPSVAAAERDLRAGRVDVAVVEGQELLVNAPVSSSDTSTTARFVRALATVLGIQRAYAAAGLSAAQAAELSRTRPVRVQSLKPAAKTTVQATSAIGVVLVFIMLTQYLTWILLGVMEEKSSRVVEVILAAVRPIDLLSGKVLGIGSVALGQAGVIVAFALVLASAVGSDLVHGTAPLELAAALLWLVLGYAFYAWVYAAAGSTIERQDQVQTLALPLSLPLIFGYITALTSLGSTSPSALVRVLAYLPPTAPFAMPVLVGSGHVAPWQFALSVAVAVVCTVAMARLAAGVYRRSILRTGGRVRLREVMAR